MPGKLKTGFVVAICLVVLPAIALANGSRPKAGHWRIHPGGFTVSRDQKSVTKFSLTDTNCGLGKITVSTKLAIRLISEGGASDWVVGYADPNRTSPYDAHGVVGQRVNIRSGHKTVKGRLDIIFVSGATSSNHVGEGDLLVSGCDIAFSAKH